MKRLFSFEDVFFVALLLVATVGLLWIVQGFLEAVFWAALLASLFHPLHRRLMLRLNGRASLSAFFVLLTILLIVILPLFFVGVAVTRETLSLVSTRHERRNRPERTDPVVDESDAHGQRSAARVGIDTDNVSEWLSSGGGDHEPVPGEPRTQHRPEHVEYHRAVFLMMYLVFFFLRDGVALLERLVQVIPLGDQRERRLFRKFAEVSRATLKGTVVVAIIQGTLGGVALALVGIEGAVFWGVVMTILSVLPAVGTSLVWLPAALWLFATGATMQAVALLVMGVLIGFIDNFLRPVLVGRDTKMPDYLILLSTLGGITAFGLSGFVIGPIIAALCVAGWDMFAADFGETQLSLPRLPSPVS